jgi:hypothetical protein
MAKKDRFRIKLSLLTLLMLLFFQLRSQPAEETDEIVFKIYNQDFKGIPEKIENLKRTSPQIASYIRLDYLWWQMISNLNTKTENDFLKGLNLLAETNSGNQDFNKLAYFIYRIRYDNLRKKSFSKYLALLKFHLYVENISAKKTEKFDSFETSILQMMMEINSYMKYRFFEDYGIQSKKNKQYGQMCLRKIENLKNTDFKSFEVIKTYFLGKIYLEIENDNQQAIRKFEKLSVQFPENTIFRKTLSACQIQQSIKTVM